MWPFRGPRSSLSDRMDNNQQPDRRLFVFESLRGNAHKRIYFPKILTNICKLLTWFFDLYATVKTVTKFKFREIYKALLTNNRRRWRDSRSVILFCAKMKFRSYESKWGGSVRLARLQPGTMSSSWMLPVVQWTGGLNTISWIFFAIFLILSSAVLAIGKQGMWQRIWRRITRSNWRIWKSN